MKRHRVIIAILSVFLASPSMAWDQTEIVRIEEDWELVVSTPDELLDAPQLTVAMVPFSQSPDLHLQVNLNYALKPDFASGGIQIRIQNDEETVAHQHRKAGTQLSHSSETINWTSVVQKTENGFVFGVQNGSGQSWGDFGGQYYSLFIKNEAVSGGLNGYDPRNSLENSGTTYGRNRVASLQLKKFRIFDSAGQTAEYDVSSQAQ